MKGTRADLRRTLSVAAILALWLAAAGPAAETTGVGINDPAARFRGAPTYDFVVTNVRWEAATPEYSYVTFDLYWSHSWRAKWTEPAETSVTGKDLEVENWDAAWVLVKFLPEKDSKEAIERNHWLHATLDTDPTHHVMPAGAMNAVRLSEDGTSSMGVFIYRDAVGHGVNEWKGIKLRWNHRADKVAAARAGVRAYAIPMVYVPRGPFKVGSGSKSAIMKYKDGPTFPMTRSDPNPDDEAGSLCDGSWRGGPVIPFLVDEEWNGPSAEGSMARRIGREPGQLWSTLTYPEVGGGLTSLGTPGTLGDAYPTGYEGFYCMKYNLTQGQYVDFLNVLPPDVAAGRAFLSSEFRVDYPIGMTEYKLDVGPEYQPLLIRERGGLTITLSRESLTNGCGALPTPPGLQRKTPELGAQDEEPTDLDDLLGEFDKLEQAEKKRQTAKVPPVYSARLPFRSSCGFSLEDVRAYAVWAGLRPMTEIEMEKAGRGSRNPVPYEHVWGSTNAVRADTGKDLVDAGLPTERCRKGNHGGGYGAFLCVIRAGCFATPTSDRESAGASYWGILELGGDAVPLLHRQYLGTHGDGSSPAGVPGGSLGRNMAPFRGPEDWPEVMGGRGITDRGWINKIYIGGRFGSRTCRLVSSAPGKTGVPAKPAAKQDAALAPSPAAAPSPDAITVANVKMAAGGQGSSTISFDLAWKNSWRAKWTEPANKNVTGKPLPLENWDAAWVFVKFIPKEDGAQKVWRHALLDANAASHRIPAGAALDVGLTDDGSLSVGVFVYRATPGHGPVAFKNIELRCAGQAAPGKVSVHAMGMVYVPAGAFRSKTPWKTTFTTIRNPDATAPDGCRVATNAPARATWPNGARAFYSMKHGINQGLYASYLNFGALNPDKEHASYRPSAANYGFGRQTVRFDEAKDMFVAEQPDLPRSYLSWAEILAVTAWAGLRPITDLEYEKACRGARAVARAADAWADGICAPAAGLAPGTVTPLPRLDHGASYWGIRGLSLTGCKQEWPGTVSDGQYGFRFTGVHSTGATEIPADWPKVCAFGQHYGYREFLHVGVWLLPTDLDNLPHWEPFSFDRTGRYGARAVRTAPFRPDESSTLQINAFPNLFGYDVGIFDLTGRFRTDSDQAIGVDNTFPMHIRAVGGPVLADQRVLLDLRKPEGQAPAIASLEGGAIGLRLFNATDRPVSVSLVLQPVPAVKPAESVRRVEIAAGKEAVAAFPVPRQWFPKEGPCIVPYRVTIGSSAALEGETTVELRTQTRWWITKRVKSGLQPGEGDDGLGMLTGALFSDAGDVFSFAAPAKGWQSVTCGSLLPLGEAGPLPSQDSKAIGATRVIAPGDANAVVDVRAVSADGKLLSMNPPEKGEVPFFIRVWFNDHMTFDSRNPAEDRAKPIRLRKGANTVVVEWQSNAHGKTSAGGVLLRFNDAKTDKPVPGLLFDMEQK
jgi:formylglycine-generating enzyme required for sulfatase activity